MKAGTHSKYAQKGGLPRATLADLVSRGLTLREIASEVDRSISTVRYWLARHGLKPVRTRWRQEPETKPSAILRRCSRHGLVQFSKTRRGGYVCPACASEKVSRRRRRVKEILVEEAGGRCAICGYERYTGALHFHHVDPATKSFGVGNKGVTRSLAKAREEARKCVLLCSNCHAEVEGGVVALG